MQARLGSSGFLSKATPEVVAESKKMLEEKQEQLAVLKRSLDDLDA